MGRRSKIAQNVIRYLNVPQVLTVQFFLNKFQTIVINNVMADCISVVLTYAGGIDSTEENVVYVIWHLQLPIKKMQH